VVSRDWAQPVLNIVQQHLEVLPGLLWPQAACLDARQIEEIADESVEPLRFLFNRLRERLAFILRPVDVLLPEAARRGHDGRKRRAKIVGHGVEQRAAELIRPPQNLRFGGFVPQP
jgi:hypothetical protein